MFLNSQHGSWQSLKHGRLQAFSPAVAERGLCRLVSVVAGNLDEHIDASEASLCFRRSATCNFSIRPGLIIAQDAGRSLWSCEHATERGYALCM